MVSRETKVQAGAGVLAFGILIAVDAVGVVPETGPVGVIVTLAVVALLFGGAHTYLAIRGESGSVPVDARWRYVVTLTVILALSGFVWIGGDQSVGPTDLRTLAVVVGLLIVAVYLVSESVDGYRTVRDDQ